MRLSHRAIVSGRKRKISYYGTATALTYGSMALAAASVGNYALFAGGHYITSYWKTVNAYNKSLVQASPTVLSNGRYALASASNDTHALFLAGKDSSYPHEVDAYDVNLTRTNPAGVVLARHGLTATRIGNYIIAAGGYAGHDYIDNCSHADAYDASLVRSTPAYLSIGRSYLTSVTIGSYALFVVVVQIVGNQRL
jgi:hypothetical protein